MVYNGTMHFFERNLKTITQILLLAIIAIVPFIRVADLYFPFISGKAYMFRALMALVFFFWVWLLLKDRGSRIKVQGFFKNILVGAILLFFGAQLLSAFFGVDPMYSLFSSVERADGVLQYGFWVLYFLMFLSVFREQRDWKLFFAAFTAVAVALSAYSWYSQGWQAQLYGVFGNPAYFAALLLFAIGFSLVAFERKLFYPGPAHYAFGGAAGFFALTLVFTQVRGAYVGIAGAVLLFFVLSALFLRKTNKKFVFASGLVLLMGLGALGGLFAAKDTEFVRGTRLLYRITEVTEVWESGSTRERLLNWSIALKAFRERPVFGYGPENYGSAANTYYDYRIGVGEPWFDRAHNQALDTLATGGIVVFSAYLFLLGAAALLIFKIGKQKKVLSFLLASIFFAYFLQSLFLFDLIAVYLGLFPFLAFLVSHSSGLQIAEDKKSNGYNNYKNYNDYKSYPVLGLVGVLVLFIIYTTAFVPWKANAAVLQFFVYTENGLYKEAEPFLRESFEINSPYTHWEVRKRAGWQFANILLYNLDQVTDPAQVDEIKAMYDYITPELEKFIEARPYDPQMYFVLARVYRVGSNKLGIDDLEKAEAVITKGFQYSDLRVEYQNEFALILIAQGRVDEAEEFVREYAQRTNYFGEAFPHVTLGHFYYVSEQYGKAFEEYEKAGEAGYAFFELGLEYNRYLFAAQEVGAYEEIIEMGKAFIARWGDDADTYFNIAVGYFYLEEKEQAKEFFLKAVEADPKYDEHELKPLFLEGS